MELKETYKNGIQLANNPSLISETVFKSLLENCFSVLSGSPEIHNLNGLYNSKPDNIKEVYAGLLYISAELCRYNYNKQDALNFLQLNCNFATSRANIFCEMYVKNKMKIEISLVNIGQHIPHVVDVKWKIDYVVKINSLEQADGPLFRIMLVKERFDADDTKKVEYINFSCTAQELQDLVYKLKDAVRHCNRVPIH